MFGLKYSISKFYKADYRLYNVTTSLLGKKIGNFDFLINNNNNTLLTNMYIKEDYRRQNYGSFFLQKIENYVKQNYQSKNVRLLSDYQPIIDATVLSFFKQNGYNVSYLNSKISHENEGYYDLYFMEKKL